MGQPSYDKIVEELKKEAKNNLGGFASDIVYDGSFIVTINVVHVGCGDEYEEEEYEE